MTETPAAESLSHVRADGTAHMVDVSGKQPTVREAVAEAFLRTTPAVVALITEGGLPKGDALAVARVAGIMAAKQTSSLIPLCHPLPLSKVTVDFEPLDLMPLSGEPQDGEDGERGGDGTIRVVALVRTTGLTGVEMEALTSASVAALTLYDMVKAVDKRAVITNIRVVSKTGGKSGDWTA